MRCRRARVASVVVGALAVIDQVESLALLVRLDPETDELLAKGAAALDPKERAAAYARVQDKDEEAAVWIPLYHEPLFMVTGPKVKPIKAHGIYGAGLYKGLALEMK